MKRLLAFALAAVMLLSVTACKANREPDVIEGDANLLTQSESKKEDIVIEQSFSSSSSSEESKPESEISESETSSEPSSSKSEESQSSISSSLPPSSVSSSLPSTSSSLVSETSSDSPKDESVSVYGETRAVWISYLEYQSIMTGKTEKQFTSSIRKMFKNLADDGFNTVYVHARSHSDAMYNSDIYPWSVYCAGEEGNPPGYDPLEIMVDEAHDAGLRIEAWINPYRVKGTTDTSKISSGSPAYDWLGTDKVVVVEGAGIFFNPADEDVIDLVVSGVKEIVKNYGVDGIHFDDYFYPTTDESFDSSYYNSYKASGGKLSLSDWRRQNVNMLIKKVYSAIKSIDSGCRFGISPTGKMSSNYSSLYCDVYTWVTSSGYIDYICPQLYYGFNHGSLPYLSVLSEFNDMITANGVELIVGLAGYKSGAVDNYAGSGKNEWIENNDILSRQVKAARNEDNYGGFAIYRYDSIYNPASSVAEAVGKEYDSLKKFM
ncbi:MAG: glycoside hydrolase family 10 protein [Oscillospiraceae bacterium]